MGRIAAVAFSAGQRHFTSFKGQQEQALQEYYPGLNPVRACLDLLEPTLRTLARFTPSPWLQLARPTGNDEPYSEMLLNLRRLWKEITGAPFVFTDGGPHYGGRRYELMGITKMEHSVGSCVGVDHLLHWRLSTRDKLSRRFSRLALLATVLLDRVLTVNMGAPLYNVEEAAREQFENYVREMQTGRESPWPHRALSTKQVEKILNDAGEIYEEGPMEDVEAFVQEQHLYGDNGAQAYLLRLLRRWHCVLEQRTGQEYQTALLRVAIGELKPLHHDNEQHRLAVQLAEKVLQLYDEWPAKHAFFEKPSLGAFCHDPDDAGSGSQIVDYYQLLFSTNDMTGKLVLDQGESALNYSGRDKASPVNIIFAREDGTLSIDKKGNCLLDGGTVLPKNFISWVSEAMDVLADLDTNWSCELIMPAKDSYNFNRWFVRDTLPARKLLGYWKHVVTRPGQTLLELFTEDLARDSNVPFENF